MLHVQAANYTPGRRKPIRLVVVHTMEGPEGAHTARDVAGYFAGQSKSNGGSSAHFCLDAGEVVSCVGLDDTAWAAPGANADGIQVEHAGTAGQSATQWGDDYSEKVLARSAALVATLARRYGIPLRHLTDAQLRAGQPGIVGHDQVSQVYRKSDHTDPGPHFPWDRYLQLLAAGGGTPTINPEEDPVPVTPAEISAIATASAIATVERLTGKAAAQQVHEPGTAVLDPITDALTGIWGEVRQTLQIAQGLQHGSPVTLGADQVSTLAQAIVAAVGPGVAGAVAAELGRRLAHV